MKSHQTKAAQFAIGGFSLIVLAISASTSFGFFYAFFDSLLPPDLLGPGVGAFISGAVGVLLFDVACSIWLFTFLHHAGTPEQRAITLIMTAVTFIGSAAASVAHLGLTATGDLAIEESARGTIGMVSLIVVILGVICNFGAALAYQRFSYDNKIQVRESDRLDMIQKAEDEQAGYLDTLVAQEVKELLTSQAPQLAAIQAERLAAKFYRGESAKYGSDQKNNSDGAALPTRAGKTAVAPTSYHLQKWDVINGRWVNIANGGTVRELAAMAVQAAAEWRIVDDRGTVIVDSDALQPNGTQSADFLATNGHGGD